MRRSEPIPLSDALAAVRKELGVPSRDAFALVRATWTELAGDDVAAHTRVRSLRDGDCIIEVDGPVWATRARYLGAELLRAANDRCGTRAVASVRVVVGRSPSSD